MNELYNTFVVMLEVSIAINIVGFFGLLVCTRWDRCSALPRAVARFR